MGRSLDLLTVAVGLETEAQVAALHRLGCQVGQGYFLGRPMPAADVPEWLAARPGRQGPGDAGVSGSTPDGDTPAMAAPTSMAPAATAP